MKRTLSILFLLSLICLNAAGCSSAAALSAAETPVAETPVAETPLQYADTDIDIDLTSLGSTIVYAEVYNMMMNPSDYMGKTVKMSGPYYASFLNETGLYYHFVIIEDATACCQSGLEFILNGEHEYPADYPADNTNVEITGVFSSYEELGETYYYLAADYITIIE